MQLLTRPWRWLADRLGWHQIEEVVKHPVPPETASNRTGWMYIWGNATLVAFLVQVLTGSVLATKYIPSTAHAYDSLLYITNEVPLGYLLRGMHFYGASAMMILIAIHTLRVFLTGSYKFPRELNWLTGVALLVLTFLMAFTGQLLRWDENGVTTVAVASYNAARIPLIGNWIAEFLLAGDRVGGSTLSRFFAFHVFMIPLSIFAVIGAHIYLLLHHGVSELPKKGDVVDPETYRQRYDEYLKRRGRPYWPDVTWKEITVGVVMVGLIAGLAYAFGPRGPNEPPDPTLLRADPRPDWWFLWYYALLAYKPRGLETFVMVYAPLIFLLFMIALPFVFPRGERHPLRRPWALFSVTVVTIMITVLTGAGFRASWVPDFATEPLGPDVLGVSSGPVYEGAQVYYEKGCQYCHAVAGQGGDYGPDLTDVSQRLPQHEIVLRIVNGIADMPAYGNQLTVDELNAMLIFLQSLSEETEERAENQE
jgi:ubiquinol-cytochrome c reductase cytochrome b subunit